MFKTQFGKALDEETFDAWMEKGRNSNIGYHYLVIIWNTLEEEYQSAFVEAREELGQLPSHLGLQEKLVAIYDLYSESRISLD
tara:strand:- start:661 stop:909 length:249 start_codon:yes stop_codon:yes gene_type:complete